MAGADVLADDSIVPQRPLIAVLAPAGSELCAGRRRAARTRRWSPTQSPLHRFMIAAAGGRARRRSGGPALICYSAYSGQNGAVGSYRRDVSCWTARSASIRPFPKHSS